MAKIFISYRREDSQYQTDKLYDLLSRHVAKPREDIFLDVDNIPFGLDFVEYLDGKVSECEVLLAVIGKGWLASTDPASGRRRIDDAKDFVRIEIASALKRGIPVVPVLLDGAPVPPASELPEDLKPLSRRNGIVVTRRSFDADVASLVNGLPIDLGGKAGSKAQGGSNAGLFVGGGLVAAVAALAVFAWVDPLDLIPEGGPVERAGTTDITTPETPGDAAGGLAALSDDLPAEPAVDDIDPVDDTATLAARAEAVRGLQSALRDLGLYTSVIDGDAGPGTRSAVTRFTSEFGGSALDLETASVAEIEALTGRVEREVIALAGRESAAWAIAQRADTIGAYRAYLTDYPSGANASSATSRIQTLEREAAVQAEAAAWSRAQSTNTIAAYQSYLRDYSSGANASAARSRIASLTPSPEPQYRTGQIFRDTLSGGGRSPEMVVVPSGSFTMGSPSGEAGRGEDEDDRAGEGGQQRTVRIGYEFAVGKYEVTWAEWEACVADGGCSNSGPNGAGADEGWGKGSRPVINVSWEDAQAYARWLSRKTGERYRLLSEAEWEYVARAGTTSAYFWGTDANSGCAHMNGADATAKRSNSGWTTVTCDDGYLNTAPVGSYRANGFGLYDMTGNVWEWTEDCYVDSYSGAPTDGSARSVSDCSRRVLRGGSWDSSPRFLRSAGRFRSFSAYRNISFGFRVARTL